MLRDQDGDGRADKRARGGRLTAYYAWHRYHRVHHVPGTDRASCTGRRSGRTGTPRAARAPDRRSAGPRSAPEPDGRHRAGRDALHDAGLDVQRLQRGEPGERDDAASGHPTARAGPSSPRGCAIPSGTVSYPGISEIYRHGPRHRLARRQRAARGAEPHRPEANKYGWPYVYADGQFNPQDQPPGEISMQEWARRGARSRSGLYTPHSAPMQIDVLHGYPVSRGVPRRRLHCDARIVEPAATLRLRGAPHPLRERPTRRLRALYPGISGAGRRRVGATWRGWSASPRRATARCCWRMTRTASSTRIAYTGAARDGEGPDAPTNAAGADIRMTGHAARSAASRADAGAARLRTRPQRRAARSISASPAFDSGAPIPEMYGAEGTEHLAAAPLERRAPLVRKANALSMEDPDVRQEPAVSSTGFCTTSPRT